MSFSPKSLLALFSLAAIGVCADTTVPADVRGGVTYDFEKISAERFKAAPKGEANLLTNGNFSKPEDPGDPYRWGSSYCYIHHADGKKVAPWRAKVKSMVKWEVADGVGTITKSPAIQELCGPIAASVSGAWTKIVKMPNLNGGTFRLSFEYQAKHDFGSFGGVLVFFKGEHKIPGRGKETREYQAIGFPDRVGDWGLFSRDISVPPGTQDLDLIIRIDGVGFLKIRNVTLAPVEAKEKLSVRLSPQGFLDSVFALSRNQPAVMTFVWKRNGTKEEAKLTSPSIVMTLPAGVEFKEVPDGSVTESVKALPDGGSEVRVKLGGGFRNRPERIEGYDFYLVLPAMVTTKAAPGTKLGNGTFRIEDGGKTVSNVEKFSFDVIPEIKISARPKEYFPGFYIGGRYYNFDQANFDDLSSFLQGIGVRWIVSQPPSEMQLASWRKSGIEVITPEMYYIANGFRVGNPAGRPEADKFKYNGATSDPNLKMSACPASIYEKRPFFMEKVVPEIRKALKGTDGLWSNWEPYMFSGKGCFCDVCRAKFAQFVNVPLEQMKKEWPQELTRGKKYYEQGVRFRSLEHAKLVKTIDEAVIEATGGKNSKGFIPGIAWIEMASFWRDIENGKEVHQSDYADSLRWIDPWGPYPCWDTQLPYAYRKSNTLSTFLAAKDVRATVNADYPAAKRPKLLAFPHGIQGSAWVTQPEALEMDLNSFFFNGFEAATLYIFPRGYDNRYWAAFARSAEYAAAYEKFVNDGKRIDSRIVTEPIAPYALPTGKVARMNHLKSISMLQHVAYEWNGKIIVPVFNFWEKGSAFFTLKVSGLDPKGKYQLTSNGKLFVPGNSGFFSGKSDFYTGKQLAAGVELYAGAMRCAVYEITPGVGMKGAEVTAPQIRKMREALLPELEKAAAEDRAYEERYGEKESKLVDVGNDGISGVADSAKGVLSFTSGKNRIVLNCRDMSITDWTIDGRKLVGGTEKWGLGTVAFWEPSFQLNAPFVVTAEKKIPGGVEITGEVTVNNQMCTRLESLLIRQSFRITDRCGAVAVKTELVNASSDEAPRSIEAGVRYHLFPMLAAEKGGRIELFQNGKTVNFVRNFSRSVFSKGDAEFEKVIRKTFEIATPTLKVDAAHAEFVADGIRAELTLTPAKEFVGFALWDGSSQLTTTFEPCFKMVTLPRAGAKAEFGMNFKVTTK